MLDSEWLLLQIERVQLSQFSGSYQAGCFFGHHIPRFPAVACVALVLLCPEPAAHVCFCLATFVQPFTDFKLMYPKFGQKGKANNKHKFNLTSSTYQFAFIH